jgi:hypothetical protein
MSEKKSKKEKFKLLINVKHNSERYSAGAVIELSVEEIKVFRQAGAIKIEDNEESEEE